METEKNLANNKSNSAGQFQAEHVAGSLDRPFTRLSLLAAVLLIVSFFLGIATWANLAPLSSAVIAPGIVSVDSYRKKIQHLEGGIVEELLVRDGDPIRRGQVLVKLRSVAPTAMTAQLRAQRFEAIATIGRLEAERDGSETITFPAELIGQKNHAAAKAAIVSQTKLHESRRQLSAETRSIIAQKSQVLDQESQGLKGQLEATKVQLKLVREEISDAKSLYDRKLMPKTKFLDLKQKEASLEGNRSRFVAEIAKIEEQKLELRLKVTQLRSESISIAVKELSEVEAEAYEIANKLVAAEDVLRRTVIRSPIEGKAVNVSIHTRGGVVSAGETLLEIVPSNDKLVVEARVRTSDIDQVKKGLPTHVLLSTFSKREQKFIDGSIGDISADRMADVTGGEPYYRARIRLDPASVEAHGIELLAGMGAEVYIRTGDQTALEYLLAPVVRGLNRSMREN